MRGRLCASALVFALVAPSSAGADPASPPPAQAEAVAALRKAAKLDPSPANQLKLAQALAASGRLVDARRLLAAIVDGTDSGAAARRARAAAKKALSDVQARIGTIKVTITGPSADKASTLVDGVEASPDANGAVSVDPGKHTVAASGEGFERVEKEVRVAEGGQEEVELKLGPKRAAAPADSPAVLSADAPAASPSETKAGSRVPGITLTLIGAAPLLAATVFGAISLSAGSSARSQCTNNLCPPAAASDLAQARTFGDASTVGFVAGGLIAASGIVLIIVAPGDEPSKSARAAPWVGPGGGGVRVTGSF